MNLIRAIPFMQYGGGRDVIQNRAWGLGMKREEKTLIAISLFFSIFSLSLFGRLSVHLSKSGSLSLILVTPLSSPSLFLSTSLPRPLSHFLVLSMCISISLSNFLVHSTSLSLRIFLFRLLSFFSFSRSLCVSIS